VQLALLGVPPLIRRSMNWPERRAQLRILAVGWPLVITAPGYWMMSSSDRWLISHFFGDAVTGIYNFSAQFGLLAHFLASAVTATWLPEVARIADANTPDAAAVIGRAWERVTLLFTIAWFGIALFGPELIRFVAAPSFFPGTAVVAPIAAGALFNGLLQLGMTGLVLRGNTSRALVPTLVCAFAGFGANFLIIPLLGWQSASWINAMTFAALAVWLIRRSSTLLRVDVRWGRLGAIATGLALVVGMMMLSVVEGTFAGLALKVLVFTTGSLAVAVALEGTAGTTRLFQEARRVVLRAGTV
jgi:O-antigen/teichoic acid export membrane protein